MIKEQPLIKPTDDGLCHSKWYVLTKCCEDRFLGEIIWNYEYVFQLLLDEFVLEGSTETLPEAEVMLFEIAKERGYFK
jgi:hypothetical protein